MAEKQKRQRYQRRMPAPEFVNASRDPDGIWRYEFDCGGMGYSRDAEFHRDFEPIPEPIPEPSDTTPGAVGAADAIRSVIHKALADGNPKSWRYPRAEIAAIIEKHTGVGKLLEACEHAHHFIANCTLADNDFAFADEWAESQKVRVEELYAAIADAQRTDGGETENE